MNRDPVISICIPAYRRTGFLKRLLDSLAIQTFTDFEVVLTDDSPDDSVAALIKAHPLADKIRYFKNQVTLGTPENWNEGLRRAAGEWIKIMHDDDWFSTPESLGTFAAAVAAHPSHFYFCAYLNVTSDGKQEKPFAIGNFVPELAKTPELLLSSNRVGPPSVVLFRAQAGMFFDNRMRWLVDIDFYIRYLKQFPPATYLPETLVNIGISESQVTKSSFGNPAVEIPERMLLAGKIGYGSLRNWKVYDSWWRFLRNGNIRSEAQFRANGYLLPLPAFLSSMMAWQRQVPPRALQSGLLSKLLMSAHFVLKGLRKP